MTTSKSTTDHDVIRQWAERRKGHPAVVKATHRNKRGNAGLLRIDFDPPNDSLDQIEWDEFFETFDQHGLTFLYQEKTASGRISRFNKFVSEETAKATASARDDEDEEDDDIDAEEDDDEDDDDDAVDEDAYDEDEEDEDEDELDEDDDDEDEIEVELDDDDEDEEDEEKSPQPRRRRS